MSIKSVLELKQQPRSGLALGGMGSGWFEIRHDGRFYNWNIFNNSPYADGPKLDARSENALFFMVRYQIAGDHPRIKILQIPNRHDVGTVGSQIFAFPWMSGVARIESDASFPFTHLTYTDPEMPFVVEMEAFSPFIPHDAKNSSLPAAIFNFSVRSTSSHSVQIELVGTLANLIGHDVARKRYTGRLNRGKDWTGVEMGVELVAPDHDTWGTQALFALNGDAHYYLGWDHRHPFYEKLIEHPQLPNSNDTGNRNHLKDEKTGEKLAGGGMKSSLAVSRTVQPKGKFSSTFIVSWHIPNRYAKQPADNKGKAARGPRRLEGYYYANHFANATAVGAYVRINLKDLTARTRKFQNDFFDSTLPGFVLEQVNSHLNTFVTSAWFTKEGNFGIQEGMTDDRSWGPLATIDVSLYGGVMIAALFPELDQSTMRAHARLQKENGEIGHGVDRNFSTVDAREAVHSRLDLPSQFVLLALRNWFWTGNREYLQQLWPHIKSALDYVLRERDSNADLLPDMAGAMCSYDNFPMFGAASYVASLWLAALAQAVQAAKALGDLEAAARYAEVLGRARPAFEAKLWNRNFYRLYNDQGGKKGDVDDGCLTDQIIGQWTMHLCGQGYLFDRLRVQSALKEIIKRNTRYWGLRNCTWPNDTFVRPIAPDNWGDQGNTCWSGTELAFASFLLYEGMHREALAIIRNVDERFRTAGLYFDHQEFGGHYFRPMASWAILNGFLGLRVNAGAYTFSPCLPDKYQRLFFAHGNGTGHYTRVCSTSGETIRISVGTGTMYCRQLGLGLKMRGAKKITTTLGGHKLTTKKCTAVFTKNRVDLSFLPELHVVAGAELIVKIS